MEDERFERMLRGYPLPETSAALDQRVLEEGTAILASPPPSLLADVTHAVLHRLGFGYVAWLLDLVTTTDAEYRVDFA